jgi:hypothetical protein
VRVALIEVLGTQVSIFVRDAPAKIPTLAKIPTQHGLARFIHRRHSLQRLVRYAAELSAISAAGGPVISVPRLHE